MNKQSPYEKCAAFTLAEVLITLLIIGVVSSIVIPGLIQNTQNMEYKVAYKKAYAVANQAWLMAYSENLLLPRTSQYDNTPYSNNYNAFKSKFNVVKDCNNNNNSLCWASGETLYPGQNAPISSSPAFIDNSGFNWSCVWPSAGNLGDQILVDTNGFKGPNKYGRDRFVFSLCDKNNNYGSSGIPVKFCPFQNMDISYVGNWCPSGGCYYKTWLTE